MLIIWPKVCGGTHVGAVLTGGSKLWKRNSVGETTNRADHSKYTAQRVHKSQFLKRQSEVFNGLSVNMMCALGTHFSKCDGKKINMKTNFL